MFTRLALTWAQQFEMVQYTNNNDIANGFKQLLGIQFKTDQKGAQLPSFQKKTWQMGFIGYDFKNFLEPTFQTPPHSNRFEFPPVYFFVPDILICFEKDSITIHASIDIEAMIKAITQTAINLEDTTTLPTFQKTTTFDAYQSNFNSLKKHILQGDIYITNYCIAFEANNHYCNPLDTFIRLQKQTPTPFASFVKYHDQYLICASPERYLKKDGQQLISQPIKGTAARGNTIANDQLNILTLQNSDKEKTENVMIVDMVRNDLSRICEDVKVAELFGIYTFETVHQMISTICGTLKNKLDFDAIIQATYPMGSMTGAPKINAVNLSAQLENFNRELYSGCVGYISPEGDFDFNVVIRSILHNAKTKQSAIRVGSAITYNTNAQQEWDECILKAKSLLQLFRVSEKLNSHHL
jgi:para-aminobenzoate synthetase component 1